MWLAFVVLGLAVFSIAEWLIDKYGKVKPKQELPPIRSGERYERYRRSIIEYIEREGISVDDRPAEMVRAIHSAVAALGWTHIPGVNRWWRSKLRDEVEYDEAEVSPEKCEQLLDAAAGLWCEIYVMDQIGGWRNVPASWFVEDEQLKNNEADLDDD